MATKWGIVGAGKIAHDFVHSISILPRTEHDPIAVAARDLGRAQEFAQKHDIARAYGSYEELAADSQVEIVYVAVVPPAHLHVAKLMLNSGKGVLCEKPLGMNLSEVSEMLALAKEKKLFFMEAIWSRAFPIYRRLSEIVDQNEIGEVSNIFASFGRKDNHLPEKRVSKKELGGGTILDWGVYCIQLILQIYKGERPAKIVASTVGLNENGVDLGVNCSMYFSGNRTATFMTDLRVTLPNEAEVFGKEGRVKLESPFHCPTDLVLTKYPAKNQELQHFPLPTGYRLPFNCVNSQGLMFEAQEVRRCLKEGRTESTLCTAEDSLIISEIQEEIHKQIGVQF